MKVWMDKDNSMVIVPETDFEKHFLRTHHHHSCGCAFLKHGLSVKDLIGLKIKVADEEEQCRAINTSVPVD